jgi:Ser/Thr protein kinase RdoA (MazF antagonist)
VDHHQVPEGDAQEDILDLHVIMQSFGVDEWANLGTIESATPDALSLLLEIAEQRYILRERSEGLIEEDITHRYALRKFLRQAGIPIPQLWLTPKGEPTVTFGENTFELEHEADGEIFSTANPQSLTWVSAAGKMLARIHLNSRSFPGPQHKWPSEAHIGGVVQGYINLAREKAESSEIAAVSAALSNWCDQWEAVLPSAMIAIGAVRGLPEFHIHGDYHPLNLRFNASDVTAVLNWDASRWEKRIIELSYALFYFSAFSWLPDNPQVYPLVMRGLDPERIRAFLEAYGSLYPPVPHESAILGDALLLVAPIATINSLLEDLFFASHGIDESLIDDVMDRLAWATTLPAWLGRVRRALGEMWS